MQMEKLKAKNQEKFMKFRIHKKVEQADQMKKLNEIDKRLRDAEQVRE